VICQVYSATSPEEAVGLVDAGVDFVGVFPVDTPEYSGVCAVSIGSEVSPETADLIFDAIEGRATKVVLSLSNDAGEILTAAERFRPDVLHVCGRAFEADANFRKELKRLTGQTRLMHAVEVGDRSSAGLSMAAAERLQGVADILILDTGSTEAIGATGLPHDWDISRRIVELSRIPVVLAGGLHPGNVADAVRAVRPFGVDSFTGTNHYREDGSHSKDMALVRAFCKAAKSAAE
jgi:phosphoribosylanthranilate isomerase